MHCGRDRRVGVRQAKRAEDAELKDGEAAALAGACAGAGRRDTADDDEIEPLHLLKHRRLTRGEETLRGILTCTNADGSA